MSRNVASRSRCRCRSRYSLSGCRSHSLSGLIIFSHSPSRSRSPSRSLARSRWCVWPATNVCSNGAHHNFGPRDSNSSAATRALLQLQLGARGPELQSAQLDGATIWPPLRDGAQPTRCTSGAGATMASVHRMTRASLLVSQPASQPAVYSSSRLDSKRLDSEACTSRKVNADCSWRRLATRASRSYRALTFGRRSY